MIKTPLVWPETIIFNVHKQQITETAGLKWAIIVIKWPQSVIFSTRLSEIQFAATHRNFGFYPRTRLWRREEKCARRGESPLIGRDERPTFMCSRVSPDNAEKPSKWLTASSPIHFTSCAPLPPTPTPPPPPRNILIRAPHPISITPRASSQPGIVSPTWLFIHKCFVTERHSQCPLKKKSLSF